MGAARALEKTVTSELGVYIPGLRRENLSLSVRLLPLVYLPHGQSIN
jgi:hypothetical protein